MTETLPSKYLKIACLKCEARVDERCRNDKGEIMRGTHTDRRVGYYNRFGPSRP